MMCRYNFIIHNGIKFNVLTKSCKSITINFHDMFLIMRNVSKEKNTHLKEDQSHFDREREGISLALRALQR